MRRFKKKLTITRLIKEKKKTQINKIINEKGKIIQGNVEYKGLIIRDYYEQLFAIKWATLKKRMNSCKSITFENLN